MDKRRNPDKTSFAVTEMWNTHREIARLASTGMKGADIARELGVTEVMVSYTLNSPIVKRQLDQLHAARDMDAVDVAKRIHEVAPRALERMEELLESETESIAFRAASDILDRAGHAAVKTLRTENLAIHLNKEDLDEIKQRARSIGLAVDVDVDVDVDTIPSRGSYDS